ncbi:MAG: hypothetical protein EPN57_26310 [Paraburkholderia sp.]|nr:MAG: hypothetical protein EPN57_26310 [Paraburkholderia sp.]
MEQQKEFESISVFSRSRRSSFFCFTHRFARWSSRLGNAALALSAIHGPIFLVSMKVLKLSRALRARSLIGAELAHSESA